MDIYPILSWLIAIWSGLIVPCMQPSNIKSCTSDIDVWLYPELQRGWDIYRGKEVPYQNEKEILEDINN